MGITTFGEVLRPGKFPCHLSGRCHRGVSQSHQYQLYAKALEKERENVVFIENWKKFGLKDVLTNGQSLGGDPCRAPRVAEAFSEIAKMMYCFSFNDLFLYFAVVPGGSR